VGGQGAGGGDTAAISVQSMTATPAADVEATLLEEACARDWTVTPGTIMTADSSPAGINPEGGCEV